MVRNRYSIQAMGSRGEHLEPADRPACTKRRVGRVVGVTTVVSKQMLVLVKRNW